MSNCSQNCWIDWNSAVLCFKRIFHIGVWRFAWFVRPLLATILCIWGNLVPAYNVSRISLLAKKRWPKKKRVTTPILKPTDDPKPDTFFGLRELYVGKHPCSHSINKLYLITHDFYNADIVIWRRKVGIGLASISVNCSHFLCIV